MFLESGCMAKKQTVSIRVRLPMLRSLWFLLSRRLRRIKWVDDIVLCHKKIIIRFGFVTASLLCCKCTGPRDTWSEIHDPRYMILTFGQWTMTLLCCFFVSKYWSPTKRSQISQYRGGKRFTYVSAWTKNPKPQRIHSFDCILPPSSAYAYSSWKFSFSVRADVLIVSYLARVETTVLSLLREHQPTLPAKRRQDQFNCSCLTASWL